MTLLKKYFVKKEPSRHGNLATPAEKVRPRTIAIDDECMEMTNGMGVPQDDGVRETKIIVETPKKDKSEERFLNQYRYTSNSP